jgi:hypothetical protein
MFKVKLPEVSSSIAWTTNKKALKLGIEFSLFYRIDKASTNI